MILKDVVATVSTKNRNNTTLPLVLTSVLCGTYKPGKFIIYDDNDEFKDPRESEVLNNLLQGLQNSGVNWYWLPGGRCGQVANHEKARLECETDFIWRVDDDNILPSNVLEILYKTITTNEKIGAVGPSILDPKQLRYTRLASNNMSDIYLGHNIQWNNVNKITIEQVEHLQGSTFLYRKDAAKHGYCLELSRVGHREETIFTYEMHRAGWKLYAICGLNTWHMRYGAGGIRAHNDYKLFEHDEKIFQAKLQKWKVPLTEYKFIYLDNGYGDHYAFKSVLNEVVSKHADKKIYIGACYPDAFWDINYKNVEVLNFKEVESLVDIEKHNIYKFMAERKWKKSLAEAFKEMYL